MKQNVNEKIKKYVERFDVILKRLNKIKQHNSNDKLQNFIRNFRLNYQFELYEHLRYINRQNLKTTIQRFENAKYYRNKHNKKNQNDQIIISKTSSSIKIRKTTKKIKTMTTTTSKKTLIIKNHNCIDKSKKSMLFM